MQYSNDETDKSVRKRNYYLQVFALPIGLAVAVSTFLYGVVDKMYQGDRSLLILLIMTCLYPIFFLYARQASKWLLMPDGSRFYIKSIPARKGFSGEEPAVYESVFQEVFMQKISLLLMGSAFIIFAVFVFNRTPKFNGIPGFAFFVYGCILIGMGIKKLTDKRPGLQLDPKGLWTKKLGFVPWREIDNAAVVEDKSGKNQNQFLEIYTRGTLFTKAGKPEDRINVSTLSNRIDIELMVDSYMSKYSGRE